MILEIIVATVLGICFGILTGLIPGLHVNTISAGMLAMSAFLLKFPPLSVAAFILSMCITSSFFDFIPSIFLGAPDPETALSVLPGHDLLNKGEGYRALKLTIFGGLGALLVCLISVPILFLTLKPIEPFLANAIPFILIGVIIIVLWQEKEMVKRIWALIIFLLSGIMGLLVMNHLYLNQGLFPLLSGLFGISGLLLSINDKSSIPEQKFEAKLKFFSLRNIFNYVRSAASSLIVSVLPAIGAAEAATMATGFKAARNPEDYLMIVGGISTAGNVFTLTVLYLLGKARSGAVVALKEFIELDTTKLIILLVIIAAVSLIAAMLTLGLGKFVVKKLAKMNYTKISIGIIAFITIMVVVLCGWLGLLVLLVSTAIGLLAPLAGVRRIHAMGCLVFNGLRHKIYKEGYFSNTYGRPPQIRRTVANAYATS